MGKIFTTSRTYGREYYAVGSYAAEQVIEQIALAKLQGDLEYVVDRVEANRTGRITLPLHDFGCDQPI